MIRSKKHILVPYCALSQGVRADTIVRKYPAVVTDVIEFLMKNDINIMQMPCPELFFDGIHRKPCGKKQYDLEKNHVVCRKIADEIVNMILLIQSGGYEVVGILGVDYSPSCAVKNIRYIRAENRRISGSGIFIEELRRALSDNNLDIPMIGIEVYNIKATMKQLKELINGQ